MGRIATARSLLRQAEKLVVLSGAGLSTDSGIPDYRSPGRPQVKSIQYNDFVRKQDSRRRYWARSMAGFEMLVGAQPNDSHAICSAIERAGILKHIITQNVDGLHTKAGSVSVVDLHGSIRDVICLDCDAQSDRMALQHMLRALNPGFGAREARQDSRTSTQALLGRSDTWDHGEHEDGGSATAGTRAAAAAPRPQADERPDGDAELGEDAHRAFRYPGCDRCGGMLKPDVVFFGENIPKARTQLSYDLTDSADVLLVMGTSLAVWSSLRLVKRAAANGAEIVVCTRGPTRADDLDLVRPELRFDSLSTTDLLRHVWPEHEREDLT